MNTTNKQQAGIGRWRHRHLDFSFSYLSFADHAFKTFDSLSASGKQSHPEDVIRRRLVGRFTERYSSIF
jgi:hypothetical protein